MIGNFDIINLIDKILGYTEGDSYFEMSTGSGWSGSDAESLLSSYGIPVYGREISHEESIGFYVNHRQAGWADYLLRSAGAPLLSKPLSERNARIPQGGTGKMPKAWGVPTRPKTFVDWVVRLLSVCLGQWEGGKERPFWKRGG